MSAPPEILDRVRKLLALAGSPNGHEAANAAARAQALISRHRLETWLAATEERAIDPISDGRETPLEVARKIRKWKRVLASVLAEVNGGMAWIADRGVEQAVCVAASDRDREAVRVLWEALVRRIEWASASANLRSRDAHEAFRIGMAEVIGRRLAEGENEVLAGLEPAALVRIDPARAAHADALDQFVAGHFTTGSARTVRVDSRAFAAGKAAGASIRLPSDKGEG